MNRLGTITILALVCTMFAVGQDAQVTWQYQVPLVSQDSVLNGLGGIRMVAYGNDVDGDGKKEVAFTNYTQNGYVVVFEVAGNDSLKLVWTSPRLTSGGGGSTPRVVAFGDLDGDGRGEVIYQSNVNGIFIYEWDGVTGSDNYGTAPSQQITTPLIQNTTGNAEYFEVGDFDSDGKQELSVAYNANSNATDIYYIISAVGDWSTNDPGFSTFTKEYEGVRTGLVKWGISGGSPWAMIATQFDGAGRKEILVHNWNRKNVSPMTVTGNDTYVLADTNTNKQNFYLGGANDDVALFGGTALDIDGDGREEAYLPTYQSRGVVHMISYNSGELTSIIDSVNVTALPLGAPWTTLGILGIGSGDIDKDGKKEIYLTATYPNSVLSLEFQGGDKRVPANWSTRVIYVGDSTEYSSYAIRDSVGTSDTVKTRNAAFPAKLSAKNSDLDGDGYEDILMPFQAFSDSIAVTKRTWNVGLSQYDTTKYNILNPRRYAIRLLEGLTPTGVQAKDMTVITPDNYILEQNFPNPFNPSTTIRFILPVREKVSLRIYDINGRLVRTLLDGEDRTAGATDVVWNGRSDAGQIVASGTYFYTMSWGNFNKSKKLTLLK